MTKFTQSLFAAAALTIACGAQAAPTSVSISLPQTTPVYDVENNGGSLSFAQFNAHLGTLTSVQFELYSTLSGSIDLKNKSTSTSSVSYGVRTGADLTATVAGQTVITGNWVTPSFDLVGGQSVHSVIGPVTNSQTLTFSLPSDLSAFIGTGNVSASLSALSNQKLTAGGNAKLGTDVTVDGYAIVTYTYDAAAPVPEPETYAMLLAGLGLVGVIARRRKSA